MPRSLERRPTDSIAHVLKSPITLLVERERARKRLASVREPSRPATLLCDWRLTDPAALAQEPFVQRDLFLTAPPAVPSLPLALVTLGRVSFRTTCTTFRAVLFPSVRVQARPRLTAAGAAYRRINTGKVVPFSKRARPTACLRRLDTATIRLLSCRARERSATGHLNGGTSTRRLMLAHSPR